MTGVLFLAAATYLAVPTTEKSDARDLSFLVTFDRHHVVADFSKGAKSSSTLPNLDLGLRGVLGFDGQSAFRPEKGENLRYPAKGLFDPHRGTLVLWTASFDYEPSSEKTDGKSRGNIALAHLQASDGTDTIEYKLYEYGDTVYLTWSSSVPPHTFGNVATVPFCRKGVRAGEWHQLVATWDDDVMRLYCNGELKGELKLPQKVAKTAALQPDGSAQSFVGVKSSFFDDRHAWNVAVDDFALFSRALTPLEVKNRYIAVLREKGDLKAEAFAVELNGVTRGSRDACDRLEASFDFSALPQPPARATYVLTAPDGRETKGEWMFVNGETAKILTGVDRPGVWKLSVTVGGETVVAEVNRPDLSWVGNGFGEEDEVPALWKDFAVRGRTVTLWNRRYVFGDGPLPEKVFIRGESALRSRPRLLIDGREPAWEPLKESRTARAVTFAGLGCLDNIQIVYRTTVEFDGFIKFDWKLRAGASVKSMRLVWQVEPRLSQYLMTPKLCEEDGDEMAFEYPAAASKPKMIWLVAERRGGFAYTMANDANWIYDEGAKVFFVNRRSGACRVEMIQKPVTVPAGGANYQALFLTTPTRPLPRRNRLVGFAGGWISFTHAAGDGMVNSVFTHAPLTDGSFERFYGGRPDDSVSIYGGVNSLTTREPESTYLRKYWERPGAYQYNMPFTTEPEPGKRVTTRYASISACPSTVYADYLVACDHALWTHPLANKIAQSYFDLCGDSICSNPYHGCRYKDAFGRRIDSFIVLPFRRLVMRLVAEAHRHGKTVILHGQRDFVPFIEGLADYWYPGEQYTGLLRRNRYGYVDEVPDAIWRSEFNRDVLGVGVINSPAIGQNLASYSKRTYWKYTESMLAQFLLHDIETSEVYAARYPIHRLWSVLRRYGIDDTAVAHRYYEQADVTSSEPDVCVTWYEAKDGRKLLAAVNRDVRPHVAKIDFSRISKATHVREEYKGVDLAAKDGTVEIKVPARRFRLVALDPIPEFPVRDDMSEQWGSWRSGRCDMTIAHDSAVGHDAAPSQRIDQHEVPGGCLLHEVPVRLGHAYRVSVWAKAPSGKLSMGVQRRGGQQVGLATATATGGWQKLETTVKIKDEAAWRDVGFANIVLSGGEKGVSAWFDDFELVELD